MIQYNNASDNNNNTNNNAMLLQLPRSVRWRIYLKIYELPVLNTMTTPSLFLSAIQQHNAFVIQQHQQRYQQLVEKYVGEEEEEQEDGEADDIHYGKSTSVPVPEIDPLTAMLMEQKAEESRKAELLLKYKKERARRKRGLTTEARHIGDESDGGVDRASLVIIEKDLQRLPHPTSNNGAATGNLSPEEQVRINHLKEILYIYAQEHPSMGYRQGMHEIASYLLYALEIEQSQYTDNPLLYTSILSTCFIMLEQVLSQMGLAYDASGEQSLQRMSQSILSKIYQNSPILFQKLTTSSHIPPPPIYCTRWVRLLFSREVVGFENVFGLWDIFFQFYPHMMRALEMASVARILLLQKALMDPNNSSLDLLMNVPQHRDIGILANLLTKLMIQTDTDHPIIIPDAHMTLPLSRAGGMAPGGSPMVSSVSTVPIPPPAMLGHTHSSDESFPKNDMTGNAGNKSFSFSKMKDSLGKKSESIRKKIISATNEWNREMSNGSTNQFSISTDIFTAAGDVLRQASVRQNTHHGTLQYTDPPRIPTSPPPTTTTTTTTATTPMPEPPSPRNYQHARWSQSLHERILILQNYLMAIESPVQEGGRTSTVPVEVWEALADLRKMQQELHNYSQYMT